jgi:hypothetical protein
MDSGPNHLNDISLDPRYAGLCGFTLEEFDSLFADRLELTLANLKNSGEMESGDSLEELRAEIFNLYDGYNWGGETRVLNPFSILKFFQNNSFDCYWIRSGRPGHLTSLIKKRPLDFLEPKLKSNLETELRKTDLTKLTAAPVLFHSGYLTVDKVKKVTKINKINNKKTIVNSYSLRFPNTEVESEYYADCFSIILDLESPDELESKGKLLKKYFLGGKAEKISSMFSDLFTNITFHQRPKGEKIFHSFIQLILLGMGFNVRSETSGSLGRSDLVVELPGQVFVIIELKYCPTRRNLTKVEEDEVLSFLAITSLPMAMLEESLAEMAKKMFKFEEISKILSSLGNKEATEVKKNSLLARAFKESFPKTDLNQALALAARENVPQKKIKEALLKAASRSNWDPERVESLLSQAAQKALKDIAAKDYHGPFKLEAKRFIDLGLAIFGVGSQVKALFGPGLK